MERTLLYDSHIALDGRMVDFAGWELPVQYPTGPTAEHHAVRTAAGLFDIDHMGQFEITGPAAEAFLQHVQVWDISTMDLLDAHYSLLLYGDGTVVDDIFLYKLPGRWMMVVNAANLAKDWAWLQAQAAAFDVTLTNISAATYMLALQGPKAATILQRLTAADLATVATRTAVSATVAGIDMLLGRTGYTGEDGFEIYLPAEQAPNFWQTLLETGQDDGLLPCGLAARDSLRFEACMPLYGHELSAAINPLSARLGWTISWHKPFIGRDALLKTKLEKPAELLVGLIMVEKAVPRDHYPLAVDGAVVGHVTTGMKSPTLDAFLALGYVPRELSKIGTEIDVLVRGQARKAKVVKRPFYTPRYK